MKESYQSGTIKTHNDIPSNNSPKNESIESNFHAKLKKKKKKRWSAPRCKVSVEFPQEPL
jgi:hypothetical protein